MQIPRGLRAEAEEGHAERKKQLSGPQAGVQTPTDALLVPLCLEPP